MNTHVKRETVIGPFSDPILNENVANFVFKKKSYCIKHYSVKIKKMNFQIKLNILLLKMMRHF